MNVQERRYIVAAIHPWNRQVFDQDIASLPGSWTFVDAKDKLTLELVREVDPSYIFFLHWSWKVPDEIVKSYHCVAFHMTDVPYGRGGSPLQNLIIRGHQTTKLTALRMEEEFDAGPVYLKQDLSLEGSAREIYLRASRLAVQMVQYIIETEPTPTPQEGQPVTFKRRRPEESELPRLSGLSQLYDFIRMLDADGYPRAFLVHEGFRYLFSDACWEGGRLTATVEVTPLESADS